MLSSKVYGAELVVEQIQHERFGTTDALQLVTNPRYCYTIEDFIELTVTANNNMTSGAFIVSDS